jgi:xanthosine utilization system XapX-like protein
VFQSAGALLGLVEYLLGEVILQFFKQYMSVAQSVVRCDVVQTGRIRHSVASRPPAGRNWLTLMCEAQHSLEKQTLLLVTKRTNNVDFYIH